MNTLKHIFWTYHFINAICNIITYIKDKSNIKEVWIDNDDVKHVLEKYLGCKLKRDWIDRMYGVYNPNLVNGKFDPNTIIIEYGNDDTTNVEQVKHKIFQQLILTRDLFRLENLYDYLNTEIRHVGPADQDNYLIVFSMVSQNLMIRSIKHLFLHTLIYAIIFVVLFACLL